MDNYYKMNNWYIKYDIRLKERSREMRKNPTIAEKIIWEKLLSKKQFLWYKFTRQKMLDYFIVDFYCSKLQLVIEIDWKIHENQIEYDKERSIILNKLNLKVLRYTNEQVLNNINFIFNDIKIKLGL